jgi:hypothetical protein
MNHALQTLLITTDKPEQRAALDAGAALHAVAGIGMPFELVMLDDIRCRSEQTWIVRAKEPGAYVVTVLRPVWDIAPWAAPGVRLLDLADLVCPRVETRSDGATAGGDGKATV